MPAPAAGGRPADGLQPSSFSKITGVAYPPSDSVSGAPFFEPDNQAADPCLTSVCSDSGLSDVACQALHPERFPPVWIIRVLGIWKCVDCNLYDDSDFKHTEDSDFGVSGMVAGFCPEFGGFLIQGRKTSGVRGCYLLHVGKRAFYV